MHPMVELVICVLLLIGSGFMLIGAIGLARLPDFYMRLHGPTKSTTLGVGGVVLASVVYFSVRGGGLSLHEMLVTAFLFLTAPISAHMLAKAAIQHRLPVIERTRGRAWTPGRSVAEADRDDTECPGPDHP
ncbi:Na+/H+ antiporter subunit G [Cupriavidus agavae]|uniref:Multisubunit potassium/proton antiporter PhaG subunit n=1 Tax=Cupriavidus agavae TaxID=1001822 RepID=A0A4Q7RWA1_9BURK|nr:Na+/H+ antiporter subunit G [Cupriavidus agavae]RZT36890.1 multisubunit potassium/proton antiporter PhaG subunit [Cupriavidus agavae]